MLFGTDLQDGLGGWFHDCLPPESAAETITITTTTTITATTIIIIIIIMFNDNNQRVVDRQCETELLLCMYVTSNNTDIAVR